MADKIIQLKDSDGNNLYPVMTCNIEELASGMGIETKTLLWTNASPSSEFGAQVVLNNPSVLLSEYDAIEVEFYNENVIVRVSKGKPSIELSPLFMVPNQVSRWADSRYIDFDDNGVAFENCWAGNTYETGQRTLQNAYLIPYKIYGIKGV